MLTQSYKEKLDIVKLWIEKMSCIGWVCNSATPQTAFQRKRWKRFFALFPVTLLPWPLLNNQTWGPACEIISHKNSVQWGKKSKLEVDSFKCLLIFEFLLRARCSTGSWWHMLIPNSPPEPYSLVREIDSSQSTLQVRWNVSLSQKLIGRAVMMKGKAGQMWLLRESDIELLCEGREAAKAKQVKSYGCRCKSKPRACLNEITCGTI